MIIYETIAFLFLYVCSYIAEVTHANVFFAFTVLFMFPVVIIWFFTMKVTVEALVSENDKEE
jgi:ABC-type maltose transport system permease subunit